jgi:hypothetical protein
LRGGGSGDGEHTREGRMGERTKREFPAGTLVAFHGRMTRLSRDRTTQGVGCRCRRWSSTA